MYVCIIQPIRLMICWLVDAVAVVGMCFFVVLEAEFAPSIPCLFPTLVIKIWWSPQTLHMRAWFFWGVESMITNSHVLADTAVIFKGLYSKKMFLLFHFSFRLITVWVHVSERAKGWVKPGNLSPDLSSCYLKTQLL